MGNTRKQIRWNGWGWTSHHDTLSESEAVWRWLAKELGMPALLATPPRPLEDVTLPAQKLTPAQIADFAAILGAEQVSQAVRERAFHARGRSYHDLIALRAGDLTSAPDAVLYPRSEDEVLAILALAAREQIAVIPFGGGTGSSGGVSAGPGSVTVDLSGMDQVLEIDGAAGTVLAEAGITGAALAKALILKGMAPDLPLADLEFSSLGGRIASGGGADGFSDLRLATPQGMLDTEEPALNHLPCGSQGIFGIITKARVKIRRPAPSIERAFQLETFSDGAFVLREAAQAGIALKLLLLSDEAEAGFQHSLAALQEPRGLIQRLKDTWTGPAKSGGARLMVRFSDNPSSKRFETRVKKQGGATLGNKPVLAWAMARSRALYQRDAMLDRGLGVDRLDAVMPWSCFPALYAAVRAALDQAMRDHSPTPGAHGMVFCHIEHADATTAGLCFRFLFPRQLENEFPQGQAIRRAGIDAICAHGGRVRGHHGVDVQGADSVPLSMAVLRGVKAALDPAGIMNPGQLLPPV